MWRSDLISVETFTIEQLHDSEFISPICAWAKNHGGVNLAFISAYQPDRKEVRFVIRFSQAIICQREIFDCYVDICGHKAYLVGERVFLGPDPLEEEEKPQTLKELILAALELLSEEERKKAMVLRLQDIIEEGAHQGEFNLPRAAVLTEARKLTCPYCSITGRIRIQDGHLICSGCGHDWGDIDYLPDPM